MKIDSCAFLPKARSEEIIIKEVAGELLIYDRVRDRAHCLNETAAVVWKLCDGRTTASEIAERMTEAGQPGSGKEQRAKREGRRAKRQGQSARRAGERFTGPPASFSRRSLDLVWLALDQLRRCDLLEEEETNDKTFWPPAISAIANMSRREAVRRIGLGAAIALPIVISITAPTPAEAAVSCGATCHPCNSPIDCCGVCSNTAVPGCGPTTPRCT